MKLLRAHHRALWSRDGQQRFGECVLRPPHGADDQPSHEEADHRTDASVDEETNDRRAPAELPRDRGSDGSAIEHERRRVIDETFSLENRDDSARNWES